MSAEEETSLEERMRKRNQEIADAHAVERGSLSATLKRAMLFDPKITMKDVKKWRLQHLNVEKRPTKPNSWVGNYAKEEYQADLLFFDDLKEKIETINDFARGVEKSNPHQIPSIGSSYFQHFDTPLEQDSLFIKPPNP